MCKQPEAMSEREKALFRILDRANAVIIEAWDFDNAADPLNRESVPPHKTCVCCEKKQCWTEFIGGRATDTEDVVNGWYGWLCRDCHEDEIARCHWE